MAGNNFIGFKKKVKEWILNFCPQKYLSGEIKNPLMYDYQNIKNTGSYYGYRRTYYDEYKHLKDKGLRITNWHDMPEEEQQKLLAEKTVIVLLENGYGHDTYLIAGNANGLSDMECAIIADRGNVSFGFSKRSENTIVVYTD